MKTVMVAGATGLIGSALCETLAERGCAITALTRHARSGIGPLRFVTWQPEDPAPAAAILVPEIEKVSAVINLAGEPVVGRWNKDRKRHIQESRIRSTQALVHAIAKAEKKPAVLVNASATGYYGTKSSNVLDESASAGDDFLAGVCKEWEAEAQKAETHGLRVVRLRIGIVLDPAGGALGRMLAPFRLGLGGPVGSGDQWMSWIHIHDLAEMIFWALEHNDVSGAVNGVAPNPATNLEFSRTLAKVLGRPCVMRVPAFALRLLAGEMSAILLEGQRAAPQAATTRGFSFRFPELEPALRDLLVKSKAARL